MSPGGTDGLRLAVGTLSILPVRAPERVDEAVAGRAMAAAPAVGALLGLAAGVPALVIEAAGGGPLLAAALAIATLAGLTRGLHLDGLADTADGLGSGRPPAGALEVMRRSDVGPFGVATLVLVLLVQVAALTAALAALGPAGGLALLVAATAASRLALPLACAAGTPAARGDGLGAAVAGSVTARRLGEALVLTLAVLAAAAALAGPSALAPPLGLLPAAALLARCRSRLGGVTGDVLGALVEVALAGGLVAVALLA